MKKQALLFLLMICLAACIPASTTPSAAQTAETFFKTFSVATPETRASWNMRDFRAFGRGNLMFAPYDWLFHINRAVVVQPAGSAELQQVIIPFWCDCTSMDGVFKKVKRSLYVNVVKTQTGWEVRDWYFGEDQPLSFWTQLGHFALWALIGPILAFVAIFLLCGTAVNFNMDSCGIALRFALGITGIITLPLVGYYGLVFFGSLLGVVLGVGAYLLFWFLIVLMIANRVT